MREMKELEAESGLENNLSKADEEEELKKF
jgi:hypothetical protein